MLRRFELEIAETPGLAANVLPEWQKSEFAMPATNSLFFSHFCSFIK
jgi:hypothetical protein